MTERQTLTAKELFQRKQARELIGLCSDPAFLKFVWTLLNTAGIYASTYSSGSPHSTSYREGRRSLGLEVLEILRAARPDIISALENVAGHFAILNQQSPQSQEDDDAPRERDD